MDSLPDKDSRHEFFSKLLVFHSDFRKSSIYKYMDEKTEIRVFISHNGLSVCRLACLVESRFWPTHSVRCILTPFTQNSPSNEFSGVLNRLHYPFTDFNKELILGESETDPASDDDIDLITSLFQEYLSYLPQLSELTSISHPSGSKAESETESKLISVLKVRNGKGCNSRYC